MIPADTTTVVPPSNARAREGCQLRCLRRLRGRPNLRPKAVLDKLSDAFDKALDDESVRKRLLDLGCDIPAKSKRGQSISP
jgi:hypothetical protein